MYNKSTRQNTRSVMTVVMRAGSRADHLLFTTLIETIPAHGWQKVSYSIIRSAFVTYKLKHFRQMHIGFVK